MQNNYFITSNMGSIIFLKEVIPVKKKVCFFTAIFLILKKDFKVPQPTF